MREGEPLRLELEAFVQAVAGEAPIAVTGEDGREALAVALTIVQDIERASAFRSDSGAPWCVTNAASVERAHRGIWCVARSCAWMDVADSRDDQRRSRRSSRRTRR
jgi:hypothetical protein